MDDTKYKKLLNIIEVVESKYFLRGTGTISEDYIRGLKYLVNEMKKVLLTDNE